MRMVWFNALFYKNYSWQVGEQGLFSKLVIPPLILLGNVSEAKNGTIKIRFRIYEIFFYFHSFCIQPCWLPNFLHLPCQKSAFGPIENLRMRVFDGCKRWFLTDVFQESSGVHKVGYKINWTKNISYILNIIFTVLFLVSLTLPDEITPDNLGNTFFCWQVSDCPLLCPGSTIFKDEL